MTYKNYGDLNLLRNNFSNNYADSDAIIFLYNFQATSFLEISDCIFVENNSTSSDGVTIENFGYVFLTRNNFSKNSANYGPALYVFNSKSYSKLEITDCVFNDNNATLSGGAIYMELY